LIRDNQYQKRTQLIEKSDEDQKRIGKTHKKRIESEMKAKVKRMKTE
jgi:hypothetical protein